MWQCGAGRRDGARQGAFGRKLAAVLACEVQLGLQYVEQGLACDRRSADASGRQNLLKKGSGRRLRTQGPGASLQKRSEKPTVPAGGVLKRQAGHGQSKKCPQLRGGLP